MAVGFSNTNKPINPRGNDASPKAFNRAKLYSGKALSFDGVNDEITPSGSYFVDPQSGTWTFCAWIYAENSGVVFSRDNQWVELRLVAGKLTARVYDGAWQNLTLSNVDLLNEWNFVCWKYDVDNSTFTGYINGVEQLTETLSPNVIANFDRIASTGGSNFFDGKIGGVKIYDVGLTAAQVADLYNNPEKVVPTGVDNTALKLWLPMQEGAGTTAYDGSGNGNHGTISGATYTHGIGAPVSQTAVIDWNKGTNKINDSEFTASSTGAPNFFRGFTRNSTTEESPFGTFDAVKMTENNTNSNPALVFQTTGSSSNPHTIKAYIKADAATSIAFATNGATNPGNINVTTEWQAFEVTQSGANDNPHIGGFATITQGSGIVLYVWHPQLQEASSAGPYVGTIGTAQTSPVLLPQGLTTGRDITGVNLFENVRKQGALNLDGNSWAEVHDNESLDFGTGSFSLEAWVRAKFVNTGSSNNTILSLGGNQTAANNTALAMSNIEQPLMWYNGNVSIGTNFSEGDWVHIVGTYDGTNITLYNNGAQVDQDARTAADVTNDLVKYIGRDNQSNRFYNDQIAQPRIYNRALTAAEVLQNYNSGKNTYK